MAIVAGALLIACGGGDASPPETGPAIGGGGATTSAGGGGGTGGEGGTDDPPLTPGCLDAAPMTILAPKVFGSDASISAKGQRHYGLFEAEAGDWLATYTQEATPGVDLVMRLFTPDGRTLIASSDTHYPPFPGLDGIMYHFVSETQTYCLEVLEFSDWSGQPDKAPSTYSYRARVRSPEGFWGSGGPVVRDAGENDTVGEAQTIPLSAAAPASLVLGTLEGDDVDVYALTGVDSVFSERAFYLSPPGPGSATSHGFGSEAAFELSVIADDGSTVLARRSSADWAAACEYDVVFCVVYVPEIVGTTYYVVVKRDPAADPSAQAAYSFFTTSIGLNVEQEPAEDGSNDTATGATALTAAVIDGVPTYAFVGTLAAGDADWWLIPGTAASEELAIWCGSSFFGTGVEALTLEAWPSGNTDGPAQQSQIETPSEAIRWWRAEPKGKPSHPPLSGGTDYYFKVSSPAFSSTVVGRSYFCQAMRLDASN